MKQMINKGILKAVVLSSALAFSACQEEEAQQYDIEWPIPVITSVSPETVNIGGDITIMGEVLQHTDRVYIGNTPIAEADINIVSETEMVIKAPRKFEPAAVRLENKYERVASLDSVEVTPIYPDILVLEFPSELNAGGNFTITGENMDLVTAVKVGDETVNVDGKSMDALTVVGSNYSYLAGDEVMIECISDYTDIIGGTSELISVVMPSEFPELMPPVLVFDFEDGVNPFSDGGGGATSAINGNDLAKGMGENYMSVMHSNVESWKWLGGALANNGGAGFDLSEFGQPHLTFLANTNGNSGYVFFEIWQNETKWGLHLNPANSDYDYSVTTEGWQWISIDLNNATLENWGGDASKFDPSAPFDWIQVDYSGGNVSGNFEIHIDQVMFTNGAQGQRTTLFNFDDGNTGVFNNFGGASVSTNGGGLTKAQGDSYLSVTKAGADAWAGLGEMIANNDGAGYSFADYERVFLSFMVNTNGKTGYFDFEMLQGSEKLGMHFPGYSFGTGYEIGDDGWERVNIDLTEFVFEDWDGNGEGKAFDPAALVDQIKFTFKRGNGDADYEVHVDDIVISDSPIY
ncbi:IPT/TIG domain-containing protein [Sediminitomix flava]|uniref:IPT/TIG domain-containing protein n=1 Tax=Sediminitomix flava TaxID=379075 RepID=A0A316A4D3_SEDFL|nr:IPT/TIG domain-containing protein [Sediminitomix flava]PWJ44597.1 IPT/TIG domain-containing protein [Sediminitomix flava]